MRKSVELWAAMLAENPPQLKGALCQEDEDGTISRCCLGVGCDCFLINAREDDAHWIGAGDRNAFSWMVTVGEGDDAFSYSEIETSECPEPVCVWLGLRTTGGDFKLVPGMPDELFRDDRPSGTQVCSLVELNDELCWDLTTIGEFIREWGDVEGVDLFVKP